MPKTKPRPQPETIDEAGSILNEIETAERQLREADQAVEDAKVMLKAARETQTENLSRLRELTGTRLEVNPLFDNQEEDE